MRPGAEVTVTNKDLVEHTLTDKAHHLFDTGPIPANGGTATFTAPSKAGRYPFGCTFHPDMAGTLTVRVTGHRSSLTAPRSAKIDHGAKITLRTTLTDIVTHKAIPNARVTLVERAGTHGAFHRAAVRSTNPNGAASVSVSPGVMTQFGWRYAGTSAHQAVTSRVGTVQVRQVVHASLTPARAAAHHPVKVFGTVSPGEKGKQVLLQRLKSGRWVTATTAVSPRCSRVPAGRASRSNRSSLACHAVVIGTA